MAHAACKLQSLWHWYEKMVYVSRVMRGQIVHGQVALSLFGVIIFEPLHMGDTRIFEFGGSEGARRRA